MLPFPFCWRRNVYDPTSPPIPSRVSADNKEIAGQLLFSNKPIPGFDFEVRFLLPLSA